MTLTDFDEMVGQELAADKIDGLEADLNALVEAIARRSRGVATIDSLYEYTRANYPTLWKRFNGADND